MIKVSPSRLAAFEILRRIETDNAFSSTLLEKAGTHLSPKDRSLCYELTLGTLRRRIWLDAVIDDFAKNKKLDLAVRIALRLGIYQLQFLSRVPGYSAINESVNLVQIAGKTSAKGFVNAILRRAQRGIENTNAGDSVAALELHESHPRWLIDKWIAEFGLQEATALLRANNQIPRVAFRKTRKSSRAADAALANATSSIFTEDCYLADSVDDPLLELAANHEIYFQDEASQMAARAVNLSSGGRFLDVCAAPGSKTTLIAERIRESRAKAQVVAGDRYDGRVRLLRANCIAQGLPEVSTVQYDAEAGLPFADKSFSSVLVDAPCSGTGTIRHNPEIRYNLKASDFAELPVKQLLILRNASKLVAAGGKLVYSTCSLEREENENVCSEFLSLETRFRKIVPDVPAAFLTVDGFARTYPHRDDMDGFFIAAFEG
ncbi:MAG: 16S rRNA (cytosine(967)-C(5))-methyltransferase RsmB [Pyrinomonadaceae bacterium]